MTLLDAEDAEVFDTEEELEAFRDAVHLVVKFMLNDDNFESWLFELEKIRLDIDQQKEGCKIMDFEIGNLTREEILNVLRENTVNLSFTKVKDGLTREMRATLVSDMIPLDKMPKGGTVDQAVGGDSTVRVFDLDLNEWRSFRVDSLLTFSAV